MRKIAALLLLLAITVCMAACGAEDGPPASDDPERLTVQAFLGVWKYENHETVFELREDYTWEMFTPDGDSGGSSTFTFDGTVVTLLDGMGDPTATLYYYDSETLVDENGDALISYSFSNIKPQSFVPQLPSGLPAPLDPLTETVSFPNDPGVTIQYPELMQVVMAEGVVLQLCAVNEAGTDDYYTNINIKLYPISHEYNQYFYQGSSLAEYALRLLADELVFGPKETYAAHIESYIGAEFKDGGSYYSLTVYTRLYDTVLVSGSPFPLRGTFELRYYGPTGYLTIAMAIAPEHRINNYFGITRNIINSINLYSDWNTSPKPLPEEAQAYSAAEFWYDGDGDVWYWNGREHIFVGFGDEVYIENNSVRRYSGEDSSYNAGRYRSDYNLSEDFWDAGDGYYWDADAGCYIESQE